VFGVSDSPPPSMNSKHAVVPPTRSGVADVRRPRKTPLGAVHFALAFLRQPGGIIHGRLLAGDSRGRRDLTPKSMYIHAGNLREFGREWEILSVYLHWRKQTALIV
jgi:hypothetical protein